MLRSSLISFLLVLTAGAQTLRFEHFGINEGLSQSSVMCMYQDSDGFLWFGTWDGLNRYDGYTFRHFRHDPADSSTLSNNSILSITEAPDGRLWIGTANRGMNVMDRKSGTVIRVPLIPNEQIGPAHTMVWDSLTVAVASKHGVLRYDYRSPRSRPILDRDASQSAFILRTRDGDAWMTRVSSLDRMRADGSIDHFRIDLGAMGISPSSTIFSLYEDTDGRLWVLLLEGGVLEFDRRRGEFLQPNFERIGLTARNIRFMKEDRAGRFWVGTETGLFLAETERVNGVRRFTGFERYQHVEEDDHSLSNSQVYSILEDRTGVIWIGTNIGANKLLPARKRFTRVDGAVATGISSPTQFPVAVMTEGDSVLWVGTAKDLFRQRMHSGSWKRFSPANSGLSNDGIYRLIRDRQNRLWCATKYGLNLFDDRTERFRSVIFPGDKREQLWENKILDITADPSGILWLATVRGLVRYDPATGGSRRFLNNIPSDTIGYKYLISVRLEEEKLWVGTNARGLLRLRLPEAAIDTVLFPVGANAMGVAFMCFHRDRSGMLWAATMGRGIVRIDDRNDSIHARWFTTKQGLSNDFAYGILEDEKGHLWISTNNGLARFDPVSETFRTYTTKDGLPTNEFNQNSFHRAEDGTMYFGGVGGLVKFHPREIGHDTLPPPVAIVNFAIANRPRNDLLADGSAILRHTENFFSFEFSALSFEVPENNRYAYRLEGLEEEWNEAGTRRFANYTDIDPGEYTFRVKASNADGVWNETGASFRIIIVPPFYATLWFRILVVVFVFGSIIGGVRITAHRTYQRQIAELEQQRRILEERQRTRDKIARDLHDDLASTVGSAGLFIETAKRTLGDDAQQTKEYLEKTSSILNDAEEAMSDIVWSVSPKHDTIHSLATRIRLVTADLCRANGMGHTVDVTGTIEVPVTDDCRRGFYLIFKEALNNCIKHSGATLIQVSIGVIGGVLVLQVKDNGIGFGTDQHDEKLGGNGMANIRKRAEEIGAALTVTSAPGNGTMIDVRKELTQLGH